MLSADTKKIFKNTQKENKVKRDKEKAGKCMNSVTVMDHCLAFSIHEC
jgi:hypothetical protein